MGAELTVQIRSPNDGTQITQEQDYLLVSGKVASGANRSPIVDVILVLDVSGSTAKYAGVDFPEVAELADFYLYPGKGSYYGSVVSGPLNKRNSIFAAEVLASRRLLSQLNPETTRVGVITFGDDAWLRQPLTNDFEEVRSTLDAIYSGAPRGGTNMAAGILLGVREVWEEVKAKNI
jgi:Mg-chelatase subunit ChlD